MNAKEVWVQVSPNIRRSRKKISRHALIFEGEFNGVFGVKPVIVKIVQADGAKEIQILKKLKHKNVIQLIESGLPQNGIAVYHYLALEKCQDKNLGQLVKSHRDNNYPFHLQYWLNITKQIISGVEYIHGMKIIHKDLKPENILLTPDEQMIKIADFGISEELKVVDETKSSNGEFGTVGYRPRESFERGKISLKSDIFSLGVVICFTLSYGSNPFGDDNAPLDHNIKNNNVVFPKLFVLNNKTTEHLIRCMIESELDDRPTIGEVLEHPCWTGKEENCNFDYRCSRKPKAPKADIKKRPMILKVGPDKKFYEMMRKTKNSHLSSETEVARTSSDQPEGTDSTPQKQAETTDVTQVARTSSDQPQGTDSTPQKQAETTDVLLRPDDEPKISVVPLKWGALRPQKPATIVGDVTAFVESIHVRRSTIAFYNGHLGDDAVYQISGNQKKGRVLIINNDFQKTREGSEVDVRNMEQLWEGLGFETEKRLNLTAQGMRETCRQFVADCENISAVVVIIMTHGGKRPDGKEYFLGEDEEQFLLEDLLALFSANTSPHLRGIPKVFLFQACRGQLQDHHQEQADARGIHERHGLHYAQRADMLMVYPTQPGYQAIRNTLRRSWFINAVTRVFMEHAHNTHLLDMLTRVNDAVAREITLDQEIQISVQESSLRKELYLFPGWPGTPV